MKVKEKMKNLKLYIIVVLISGFTSCQKDIDIDTSTEDTNNSESVFTSRAERVSLLDGTIDDILDNTPCASVILPVTITLNSVVTTLMTEAEVLALGPDDIISFQFPIDFITNEYNTIRIDTNQDLQNLQLSCSTITEPVTCMDFNYPIEIFTVSNNQSQNIFTLSSDQELYEFLQNLQSGDFYNFNYPLSVTINQSIVQTVNNDSEILTLIEECSN